MQIVAVIVSWPVWLLPTFVVRNNGQTISLRPMKGYDRGASHKTVSELYTYILYVIVHAFDAWARATQKEKEKEEFIYRIQVSLLRPAHSFFDDKN